MDAIRLDRYKIIQNDIIKIKSSNLINWNVISVLKMKKEIFNLLCQKMNFEIMSVYQVDNMDENFIEMNLSKLNLKIFIQI